MNGIIPALAGNTGTKAAAGMLVGDHPRSRGEYDLAGPRIHAGAGSSPLSRGIRRDGVRQPPSRRIIPALAGNTAPGLSDDPVAGDHPRSRGEYAESSRLAYRANGSSPLSRGILLPARRARGAAEDHPRSRGEYVGIRQDFTFSLGSSPLSRGILPGRLLALVLERIIPALAGNTLAFSAGGVSTKDHPRSRGEYAPSRPIWARRYGSSPLSRGIP